MEYVVGFTLALFFCAAAAVGLGMDGERVFYPAVVMAVASYDLAFAVADGRSDVTAAALVAALRMVRTRGASRQPGLGLR